MASQMRTVDVFIIVTTQQCVNRDDQYADRPSSDETAHPYLKRLGTYYYQPESETHISRGRHHVFWHSTRNILAKAEYFSENFFPP